jgi:large subunit ribosomal protein L25
MEAKYVVDLRNVLGKKVKNLRKDGIIPANVYGKGIDSIAVQLPYTIARKMMNQEGVNGFIDLNINGESSSRPVVIRSISRHPVSRNLEHIDFLQVDKSIKIQANIPFVFIGDSPAVIDNHAVLLNGIDSLQVSALPSDLPKSIEVSIDTLIEFDDSFFVSDLSIDKSIEIISPDDSLIVKASAPRVVEEVVVDEVDEGLEGEADGAEEDTDDASSEESSSDD